MHTVKKVINVRNELVFQAIAFAVALDPPWPFLISKGCVPVHLTYMLDYRLIHIYIYIYISMLTVLRSARIVTDVEKHVKISTPSPYTSEKMPRYPCPYSIYNPSKYNTANRYKACMDPGFLTISRLK